MRVSDKPFSVDSKYLTLLLCKGARTAPKKKLEKFFSKNLEVSTGIAACPDASGVYRLADGDFTAYVCGKNSGKLVSGAEPAASL